MRREIISLYSDDFENIYERMKSDAKYSINCLYNMYQCIQRDTLSDDTIRTYIDLCDICERSLLRLRDMTSFFKDMNFISTQRHFIDENMSFIKKLLANVRQMEYSKKEISESKKNDVNDEENHHYSGILE